jgi:hypothetical protein
VGTLQRYIVTPGQTPRLNAHHPEHTMKRREFLWSTAAVIGSQLIPSQSRGLGKVVAGTEQPTYRVLGVPLRAGSLLPGSEDDARAYRPAGKLRIVTRYAMPIATSMVRITSAIIIAQEKLRRCGFSSMFRVLPTVTHKWLPMPQLITKRVMVRLFRVRQRLLLLPNPMHHM